MVELDTAVRLLHAAGIDASLRLPRDGVADEYLPTVRREVRAITAQLLGTSRPPACVLTVTSDGRVHLEMSEQQASPAAGAVAAR